MPTVKALSLITAELGHTCFAKEANCQKLAAYKENDSTSKENLQQPFANGVFESPIAYAKTLTTSLADPANEVHEARHNTNDCQRP